MPLGSSILASNENELLSVYTTFLRPNMNFVQSRAFQSCREAAARIPAHGFPQVFESNEVKQSTKFLRFA